MEIPIKLRGVLVPNAKRDLANVLVAEGERTNSGTQPKRPAPFPVSGARMQREHPARVSTMDPEFCFQIRLTRKEPCRHLLFQVLNHGSHFVWERVDRDQSSFRPGRTAQDAA